MQARLIHFWVVLIVIFGITCKSMRYEQSTEYPGDSYNYPDYPDSPEKKESHNTKPSRYHKIKQCQKNAPGEKTTRNEGTENNYSQLASCYTRLAKDIQSVEKYENAHGKLSNSLENQILQEKIIESYYDAGLVEEKKGYYQKALEYYTTCNEYSLLYNKGKRVPDEKIAYIKQKMNR